MNSPKKMRLRYLKSSQAVGELNRKNQIFKKEERKGQEELFIQIRAGM